jgi:heptosyltransferase-2
LLIHLGALGAVARSTALLAPLRRRHPGAHLTWVTDAPAHKLLTGHPRIDRVLSTSSEDLLKLAALEFDVAYVVDKSLKAAGVLRQTRVDLVRGFVAEPSGAIVPATEAARELWEIGLSDHRKFHVNKKPEIQLATEALELGPWQRDPYDLPLTEVEGVLRQARRREWSREGRVPVVGLNTGCSEVIVAKKLTVEAHVELIRRLEKRGVACVLLGGPEDAARNDEIARRVPVLRSPESEGLRDGLVSVAACDALVTGDSLGMHMGISQGIWVSAWFGPTCAHEIEFYGRGEAVLTAASCSPCWKRSCHKDPMCYDLVSLDELVEVTMRGLLRCVNTRPVESSSFKRPSSETSSSASR